MPIIKSPLDKKYTFFRFSDLSLLTFLIFLIDLPFQFPLQNGSKPGIMNLICHTGQAYRRYSHGKKDDYDDEEMTVELELDDGSIVNCAVITILTVSEKDYIVLLPLNENGENEDGEVWFYRYSENPDDPNEEPELDYIEDDDEYENVAEAFDEYLDNCEFDELTEE